MDDPVVFTEETEEKELEPVLTEEETTPDPEQKKALRFVASHVGMAMALYVILSLSLTFPVTLLLSALGLPLGVNLQTMNVYGASWALQLLSLLVTLFKLGVPLWFLTASFRGEKLLRRGFVRPQRRAVFLALPIVLAGSMVGTFVAQSLQNLFALAGFYTFLPSYTMPEGALSLLLDGVLTVVVPAFLEEFLFRGALLQSLRPFGDGVALLLSSVLFALCHLNFLQGANALLMGLLIGYFVLRTRSVWTGVLIHFVVNLLAFFETCFLDGYFPTQAGIVEDSIALVLLAGGLVCFFFWVRREPSAFTVPLLEGKRPSVGARLAVFFGNASVLLALFLFAYAFVIY